MALSHNPKIVTDGLALYLDAANPKSYNSAENLMDSSENIQTWSAQNCTYLANATTAPDRTKTATAVMATAADVGHYIARGAVGTTVSNTIYTFSIYLKPKGTLFSSVFFQPLFKDGTYSYVANWNLTAKTATTVGTGISSSIEELDDGWFRVSSTFNSTTGAGTITPLLYLGTYGNMPGDGTSGFYMWGVQLERGSNASKYTKTTTAAITRSTAWTDPISKTVATFNTLYYMPSNQGAFSLTTTNSSSATYNTTTLPTLTDFSIVIWAKTRFTTNSGSRSTWFGMVNGTFNFRYGYLETALSNSVYIRTGGSVYVGSPVGNDIWQMHAVTKTGSTVVFYINGVSVTTTTGSAPTADQVSSLIGSYSTGVYPTDADIGMIGLYSRVLSADEIKQNFNASRGRYGI